MAKHIRGFGSLLGFLPFVLTLLIGGGIVVCYCVAISLKHVEAAFPYISDTGAYPPESCIFTLFINSAAVVALAIFTIKYLHVAQYNRDASRTVTRINTAALIIGYISAFGLMIVAAFQETNVISVHVVGAMMAFLGGTAYMFLIASLGFYSNVDFAVDEQRYAKARLAMAFISLTSFIIMNVFTNISLAQWNPYDGDSKRILWNPKDGGYSCHVVATSFEWVMALVLLAFLMTYSQEFHLIQLKVALKRHSPMMQSPASSVQVCSPTTGSGSDVRHQPVTHNDRPSSARLSTVCLESSHPSEP